MASALQQGEQALEHSSGQCFSTGSAEVECLLHWLDCMFLRLPQLGLQTERLLLLR